MLQFCQLPSLWMKSTPSISTHSLKHSHNVTQTPTYLHFASNITQNTHFPTKLQETPIMSHTSNSIKESACQNPAPNIRGLINKWYLCQITEIPPYRFTKDCQYRGMFTYTFFNRLYQGVYTSTVDVTDFSWYLPEELRYIILISYLWEFRANLPEYTDLYR